MNEEQPPCPDDEPVPGGPEENPQQAAEAGPRSDWKATRAAAEKRSEAASNRVQSSLFLNRLVAVLKCSPEAFADVASDRSATLQAIMTIAAAGAIEALASYLTVLSAPGTVHPWMPPAAVAAFVLLHALAGCTIMAGVYAAASKVFRASTIGYGGWFRAMGFASAVSVLDQIPFVGWVLGSIYFFILQFVAAKRLTGLPIIAAICLVLIALVGAALLGLALNLLFIAVSSVTGSRGSLFA